MDLDVTGLKAGVHEVPVTANLLAGTTLVAASPATITVTISAAPASPVIPASSSSPAPSG
jgi:YbbR domain-containing protein